MKTKKLIQWLRKLSVPLAAICLVLLGIWIGMPAEEKESAAESGGEAGQIWTCSMHPQIRQPNPGQCPICNMDLIPLEGEGGGGGLRRVSVSEDAAARLDLRVAPVVRAPAVAEVRLFGRIDYDERSMTTLAARVGGRLDRLFVDFTGMRVREGDHLAEIYSPDMLVAQRELIEARRGLEAAPSGPVRETRRRLLEAAREKLRLLEFSEEQIAEIERSEQPSDHLTLRAPRTGIVVEKMAGEGDYVATGDPILGLADLSTVWLELEAYEGDLQWLRYAQDVSFEVGALPGHTFHGRIAFIDPEVDSRRRVARVRVNVENENRRLKPGMFVKAAVEAATTADGRVLDPSLEGKWISPMHPEIVKDHPGSCDICGMDLVPAEELGFVMDAGEAPEPLQVPASAVLRTGERAVVYVKHPGSPEFEGREIVLGPKVGERFIVEAGLSEGEQVVTRGAFTLDSELQIQARPSMMNPNAGLEERPAHAAPEELAGQWSPVPRALYRLLEEPNEERLETLRRRVEAIDPAPLNADERARWEEFSRRLRNELAIAAESVAARPRPAGRRVRLAIEETGRYMGLAYEPEEPPEVDPETAAALEAALEAYLPLASALAEDEDEAAADAAERLGGVLRDSAFPAAREIAERADAVARAGDVEARRKAFHPLSDALIAVIRDHGIDAVGDAYVVHCPMAFGDGADWVSADPEVRNPYYGDAMYTCGSVTDTLSVETNE